MSLLAFSYHHLDQGRAVSIAADSSINKQPSALQLIFLGFSPSVRTDAQLKEQKRWKMLEFGKESAVNSLHVSLPSTRPQP